MMKLLHLEHIVETILSDVPCPECGELLQEDLMDIKHVRSKQADIVIPCHNCGSQICIYAEIEENIPQTMFRVLLPKMEKGKGKIPFAPGISKTGIQKISQSIREFKGRDVRKLF